MSVLNIDPILFIPEPVKSVNFFLTHVVRGSVRKEGQRNFASRCTRICRFLIGAFCRICPISMTRNDQLNPGKLLNLTEHTGYLTRQFFNVIAFTNFSEQYFFQLHAFFIHPVCYPYICNFHVIIKFQYKDLLIFISYRV